MICSSSRAQTARASKRWTASRSRSGVRVSPPSRSKRLCGGCCSPRTTSRGMPCSQQAAPQQFKTSRRLSAPTASACFTKITTVSVRLESRYQSMKSSAPLTWNDWFDATWSSMGHSPSIASSTTASPKASSILFAAFAALAPRRSCTVMRLMVAAGLWKLSGPTDATHEAGNDSRTSSSACPMVASWSAKSEPARAGRTATSVPLTALRPAAPRRCSWSLPNAPATCREASSSTWRPHRRHTWVMMEPLSMPNWSNCRQCQPVLPFCGASAPPSPTRGSTLLVSMRQLLAVSPDGLASCGVGRRFSERTFSKPLVHVRHTHRSFAVSQFMISTTCSLNSGILTRPHSTARVPFLNAGPGSGASSSAIAAMFGTAA
mmetsp:Transcript_114555/g.324479  ORF Transcript_114555/g.324479 Transcript_114555/m.324479 type:complete len:376 (+) Transcript_114555:1792-2919(+)